MIAEGLPQIDSGLVSLGIALVGTIVWFTRLESKGAQNASDIEKGDKRHEALEHKVELLDNRMMEKLSNIEKILAKIEGKLEKE